MPLAPPQTYDILPSIKDLLKAENVLGNDNFSEFGAIKVAEGQQLDWSGEYQFDKPDPAPDGFFWQIILMPVINGIMPPQYFSDNVRPFAFRVRIDAVPTDGLLSYGISKFIDERQQRCFDGLQGAKTAIENATILKDIRRDSYSTEVDRGSLKGVGFKTAEYSTQIKP